MIIAHNKESVKAVGKPQTLLIESTEEGNTPESVEKLLKQERKANNLKLGLLKCERQKAV